MISKSQTTLSKKRLDWLFSNPPDRGSGNNLWRYSSRNYTRLGSVCRVQTFTRSLICNNMFISTVLALYLHQQRSSQVANKFAFACKFSCRSGIFHLLHTCLLLFSTSIGQFYIFYSLLCISATSRARWLDVCTYSKAKTQTEHHPENCKQQSGK